jgi:hypothetical protein
MYYKHRLTFEYKVTECALPRSPQDVGDDVGFYSLWGARVTQRTNPLNYILL